MTSAFRVLSGGAVLTGLALAFGAGHLVIGLVGALPLLARAAQLLAPRLITRFGASRVVRVAGWVERIAFLGAALVGLLGLPHAIPLLLTAVGVGMIGATLYDVGLTALGAELVGAEERGAYFGRRTRWSSVLGVVAAVIGGLMVDFAEAHGVAPTTARGLALLAGLVPALLAALALERFDRRRAPEAAASAQTVREPLRDEPVVDEDLPAESSPLRAVLLFGIAWGLATGLPVRHVDAFALTVLHFSVGTLTVCTGLVAGAGALGATTWGRLGDRFGAKPILKLAAFAVAVNPIWYALATPDHSWPYVIGLLLGGAANSGWVIGVPLLLLRAPLRRSGEKVRMLVLFQATVGLASGGAPLIGGALLQLLEPLGAHAAYALLFTLASALRLCSLPLLDAIPEQGSDRARHVAAVMWRAQSRRVAGRSALRSIARFWRPAA